MRQCRTKPHLSGRRPAACYCAGLFLSHAADRGCLLQKKAELALRNRVPAMYEAGPPTHAGGQLMSFSPNGVTQIRAGADYIDKILRGTNPADLPVEEPRTYDFVAYVKTAAALGITFPSDAAVQVTQWIDS